MPLTQRFSANWPRKMTRFFHPLERTIVISKSSDAYLGICLTRYASDIITLLSEPWVRWTLNVYIYVANVRPTDPDWEAKGGRVFILIKHSGNASGAILAFDNHFNVSGISGGVKAHDHEPKQYVQKDGDDYTCTCLLPLCTQIF